ncbi:MAG: FIST C-terminal domain-containing protein [Rhodocyclaceae bacterium]|nr:FIST C-terminal domain-containing protein [Rhodocyclaceae bacterium]
MRVASALAAGTHPQPELAATAVKSALAKAGLTQAGHVVLFLTRDFQRQAQAALLAAARAAGCMEITGCTAYGLITDEGWLLDQSGAAALVIEAPTASNQTLSQHRLSLTGHSTLPYDWQPLPARSGLLDSEATVWIHGRPVAGGSAEIQLPGFNSHLAISTGLRPLGETQRVAASRSYDLLQLSGQAALENLRRLLPGERRHELPLHRIVALRDTGEPGVAILAANDDGSLTMAEAFKPGDPLQWAIRQPLSAEQEMNEALSVAVNDKFKPNFALMFSCIGRGPLFYGNDDRDLLTFKAHFPDTPLIGAYGSGQIAATATANRLFQNSVMTLLYENTHV